MMSWGRLLFSLLCKALCHIGPCSGSRTSFVCGTPDDVSVSIERFRPSHTRFTSCHPGCLRRFRRRCLSSLFFDFLVEFPLSLRFIFCVGLLHVALPKGTNNSVPIPRWAIITKTLGPLPCNELNVLAPVVNHIALPGRNMGIWVPRCDRMSAMGGCCYPRRAFFGPPRPQRRARRGDDALRTFRWSTMRAFNLSTMRTFNLSTMRTFRLSTVVDNFGSIRARSSGRVYRAEAGATGSVPSRTAKTWERMLIPGTAAAGAPGATRRGMVVMVAAASAGATHGWEVI